MNLLVLLVILVLVFGVGGGYGWHSGWAYGPHTLGLGAIILIVVLILFVTGRL
jgi:hypothetical protein